MKNLYLLALTIVSSLSFAQQGISFEASEGFVPGTIHGQNGFEVTEGSDGFITGQVISSEKSTHGTYSFKNGFEPAYGDQWFPIMGAVKSLPVPADYTNYTMSYDILVTEHNGSDFEFTIYSIDEDDFYIPIAGVGMDNRGFIYLIKDVNYGIVYADTEWTANTWMNVKIEVTSTEIKYYFNNVLDTTIPNFTQTDILGFNMLHNNYGGDAFYDNFNPAALGIEDANAGKISIYPNPAENIVSVSAGSGSEIIEISVYSLTGQKVAEVSGQSSINIEALSAGTYVLQATTAEGFKLTRKVIKK